MIECSQKFWVIFAFLIVFQSIELETIEGLFRFGALYEVW